MITNHWLCYQAPEIIRALDALLPGSELHLYTKETDIYAFGYVKRCSIILILFSLFPLKSNKSQQSLLQVYRTGQKPCVNLVSCSYLPPKGLALRTRCEVTQDAFRASSNSVRPQVSRCREAGWLHLCSSSGEDVT